MGILEALKAPSVAQRRLRYNLLTLAKIAAIPMDRFFPFAEPFGEALLNAHTLGRHWRVGTSSDTKLIHRYLQTALEHTRAALALTPSAKAILGPGTLEAAAALSENAVHARRRLELVPQSRPVRGRPAKRLRDGGGLPPAFDALDMFVWSTLTHVYGAGGRLSLDKNRKEGRLLDFLEAVREMKLLPDGFIPTELPIARLHRLKTDWNKKAGRRPFIGPIR